MTTIIDRTSPERLVYTDRGTVLDVFRGGTVVVGGGSAVEYAFPAAALSWTINHNLGHVPACAVFDSASRLVVAQVTNPTPNQTVIAFATATAGFARLT